MNEASVSVIIPTFNRVELLLKTVDSALCQTYKGGYEVIVVDDGSETKTRELLERHFGDRVICLEKENGGPASARNLGIRHAKGEYIAFLDADDLWLPEKLDLQIGYMEENPQLALSFTDAVVFAEGDNGTAELGSLSWSGEVGIRTLLLGCFIPTCTVVVRKSCLNDVGLFEESREFIGTEDYELWLRVAAQYEIGYLPLALSKYRQDNNSLTGSLSLSIKYQRALRVIESVKGKLPHLVKEVFGKEEAFYSILYEDFASRLHYNGEYGESFHYLLYALRCGFRVTLLCKMPYYLCRIVRNTFMASA